MPASRCPQCGGRNELVSETWESGGRLLHVRRCPSCGRETTVESAWPGGLPPSASARGRRAARAVVGLGLLCAILWIILRVIDYGTRATFYGGVADALEAFRSPVWLVVIAVLTAVAAWMSVRRVAERADELLVAHVQLRVSSDDAWTVTVTEGHDGAAREHGLSRDRSREERIRSEFVELGRRASRGTEGGGGETRRKLLSIGQELGRLVGDEGAARDILSTSASHMLIQVPESLAGLPWELAVFREGTGPLWELYAVARRTLVAGRSPRARTAVGLPLRLLLLADLENDTPGRELPEAAREAAGIMELGARRADALRVVRRTPRSRAEFDALLAEGWDVVHFAGHGGTTPEGTAGWSLPDGSVVAPEAMRIPPEAPLLVFSNACVPPGDDTGAGERLARGFLTWGARAYVGPLWDLNDSGGAAFARAFYASLADGSTLGLATQEARRAASAAHEVAWAGYVLYGDPTMSPVSAARHGS